MKTAWLFLIISLCILPGCKKKEANVVQQNLRISSPNELLNADPQQVYSSSDCKIMQAVFEGLVVPDPETMKPLPGMAERWKVSSDKKVYEFFLRDNAMWSNGTPVTAEDFVYAAKRALSSKFACAAVDVFFPVLNAKKFFNREIRNFSMVGIRAVNSRTLIIELEKNDPYFLVTLMHQCWFPLNDEVIASLEEYSRPLDDLSNVFKLKIISNGPFTFAERKPGISLLLKKNPKYWDADNVLLSSVMFSTNNNQALAVKNFSERQVDIVELQWDDESTIGDCLQDKELMLSPALECFGLAFNVTNSVFKNKNIRFAMAMAIDREKLLAKIGKNRKLAAYSFVPIYDKKYESTPLFKQDIQLARKLFEEAGYNSTVKFPPVKILCNTLDAGLYAIILEQVREDWKNVLGVDTFVDSRGFDSFFAHRKKVDFDVIKVALGGLHCNPAFIMHIFMSKDSHNYGKWADPTYDGMLKRIKKTNSKKKLRRLTKDMELYLANEMPAIPLFFNSHSFLVRKSLRGWFPNPMNMHPLKFVYFAR
ncbi:MAG: peptide ABC transporter substrate-binding protein [Puniceicoccales bacterium]|jgi:oligopeptide transport system substrate-binding protein|nr:peptide ABC transporter substrate-binding protein [Puniceicoccales bacterium]